MSYISKLIRRFNRYQQHNHLPAFCYAVVKKYSEDRAGYQAALLTYYGFLALFPLLMVLITLTDTLLIRHPNLQANVLKSITDYFPLLGSQLAQHIHSLKQSGFALLLGVLLALYGARGVANAFSDAVQNIWQVPKQERNGFPKSTYKNLTLLVIGGAGFILASVSASLAASAGRDFIFRLLSTLINFIILFWLFTFMINFSLPKRIPIADTRLGALTAAVGLVILQLVGGYILVHELKKLDELYSYFAISLGLLFWIYLQSQVLLYAVEISIVGSKKLWPRSIDPNQPTIVDKQLIKKNFN